MSPGEQAESLIDELAIRDPKDLDVEAIAFDAGMVVVYRELDGCAASLIGVGNRAIATIRRSSSRGRDRFSIGHELGHWTMHRGRSFVCRVDDIGENLAANTEVEKAADVFAAHLLMPGTLFKPATKDILHPKFSDLENLGRTFQTSLLATALRLVRLDIYPIVLASYTTGGLRWTLRSPSVPSRWWLKPGLDADSFAYDLIHRGRQSDGVGKQSAEAWFNNDDASHFEVVEECLPYGSDQALVLITMTCDMLERTKDPDLWTGQHS